MFIRIYVIANSGNVRETKGLSRLLTDTHTSSKFSRAIALFELLRISIRFNSTAKLLNRHQSKILDIIRIQRSSLSARRGFGNGGQTVPSNTLRISAASSHGIKYTLLYTGFIKSFTGLVPNNFSHVYDLL